MNRENKAKRKRRASLGPLQKFITILLTAIVVAFALMLFFKVDVITVEGNSQYSDDEVAEASGVALGDNLILVNKGQTANLIMGQLSYITEVKLLRKLPDTLLITVKESGAAAYVTDSGGASWYIDKKGKVLSQASELKGIAVTGFTPVEVTAGYDLTTAEGEQSKLTQLKILLDALESNDIAADVSAIDLSLEYNPKLTYDGRFTVELGAIDEIDYKLQYLIAVRQKLTDNQSGTIDLTFDQDKVAHFRPN